MKIKHHSILSAPGTQSGGKTLNNTVPRKLFALGLPGILFISVCALLPSPAQAQCRHWNVTGLWELRQDNEIILLLNLQQGDWNQQTALLTGTVERQLSEKGAQGKKLSGINSGKVSGKIALTSFTMEVTYPSFTSRYTGKINPNSGKMEGTNDTGAHWVSSKTFSCGSGTASEKAKPTATPLPVYSPNTNGHDSAPVLHGKVPWMAAKPGQSSGTKTLSWDGGPDHPYAEVWVKVNDEDEKFVVEKGKGTREVTVERGKTYLYILSDSGQRLATVTVK